MALLLERGEGLLRKKGETMSEKTAEKKPKATKTKTKTTTKKKSTDKASSQRDSKGRFIKGESGNPGGRPKLPDEFKKYAEKAPKELWEIATDEDTNKTLRASILEWFSEMYYGKATQQVDIDADTKVSGIRPVKFEGVLDEWSK